MFIRRSDPDHAGTQLDFARPLLSAILCHRGAPITGEHHVGTDLRHVSWAALTALRRHHRACNNRANERPASDAIVECCVFDGVLRSLQPKSAHCECEYQGERTFVAIWLLRVQQSDE